MKPSLLSLTAAALLLCGALAASQTLTPKELLGKQIFFDTTLSEPSGQSCAACHGPEVGYTGPLSAVNGSTVIYPGAVATRFGNRKPPAAAYGGPSPVFTYDGELFIGGMFWDGRATGWELGDPLAEQARGPFLNPLEQNNPSKASVVAKIQASSYATLFEEVYGPSGWTPVDAAYNRVAEAIAAYERSAEVNPFTSKYDYVLRGQARLTKEERKGLVLFRTKGKCDLCHTLKRGQGGEHPLFTDFTYDNLGIPKNPDNPFYQMPPEFNPDGVDFVDPGLAGFLVTTAYADASDDNYGKHKVPTLRNVDKRPTPGFVKAFGHNGFFKSLKEIVHFYNTRDVGVWPPPEVSENVNTDELGDLGLSSEEEDAIVAFLATLSDGYIPEPQGNVTHADASTGSPGPSLANSPNPFNPETELRFRLPEGAVVDLRVYDALGQDLGVLAAGSYEAGAHAVRWQGKDASGRFVPSGVYFFRLVVTPVERAVAPSTFVTKGLLLK